MLSDATDRPTPARRCALRFALAVGVGLWFCVPLAAQESLVPLEPVQPADEDAPPSAAKPADPFAVPDGTPKELFAFLEGLGALEPESRDEPTVRQFRKDLHSAVVEATTKILNANPTDEQAARAAQFKAFSLAALRQLGDAAAGKQLDAFVETLRQGGRAALARQIRAIVLQLRLGEAIEAGPEALKALVEQIEQFVGQGKLGEAEIGLALRTTQVLEMTGNDALAAEACKTFADVFAKSDNPQIVKLAKKLEGTARRLTLVGEPIKLEGTFFDGTKLNWEDYRGKVVLVQFWATWCIPCRREIANVKRYYDQYHEQGFDVIGVNCDESRDTLEAYLKENPMPWPNLFSTDPEQSGMDHPMATYYGVMGIPTLILVGKDGNVVSLEVRGPALGRALAKLIGPPEQQPAATQ